MILLIIIQLIVIIFLITVIVITLFKVPKKLETAMLNQYWDDEIEEIYPCTLLTEIVPDEYDGIDWDFSKYDSIGAIAMVVHTLDSQDDIYAMYADAEARVREELNLSDEIDLNINWDVNIIPTAYVYKTIGGKIRCFIQQSE